MRGPCSRCALVFCLRPGGLRGSKQHDAARLEAGGSTLGSFWPMLTTTIANVMAAGCLCRLTWSHQRAVCVHGPACRLQQGKQAVSRSGLPLPLHHHPAQTVTRPSHERYQQHKLTWRPGITFAPAMHSIAHQQCLRPQLTATTLPTSAAACSCASCSYHRPSPPPSATAAGRPLP